MSAPPERMGELEGVELWRIALDVSPARIAELQQDLSTDERARAARLVVCAVRRRFVAARAGLRRVLAGYRLVDPRSIGFVHGPHGKPAIEGGPSFSLSHSGDLAICAVAVGREVGVDVEQLRVVPEAEPIAARHLGPLAVAAMRAAGRDRDATFLRLWTRHEALVKALGVGLAAPVPPDTEDARWVTHDLDAGPKFVGALVTERGAERPCSPRPSPQSGSAP